MIAFLFDCKLCQTAAYQDSGLEFFFKFNSRPFHFCAVDLCKCSRSWDIPAFLTSHWVARCQNERKVGRFSIHSGKFQKMWEMGGQSKFKYLNNEGTYRKLLHIDGKLLDWILSWLSFWTFVGLPFARILMFWETQLSFWNGGSKFQR